MRGCSKKGQPGLIPLSIGEIFETIGADKDHTYTVSVSYMEVSSSSTLSAALANF